MYVLKRYPYRVRSNLTLRTMTLLIVSGLTTQTPIQTVIAAESKTPTTAHSETVETPSASTKTDSTQPAATPPSPAKTSGTFTKKDVNVAPQQLAAEPTTMAPQVPTENATVIDLPPFPHPQLACGAVPPKTPHIAIILKTKTGEKQVRHRLACLKLTLDRDDLTDESRLDLDSIATYITQLDNVVRMYLDLITHTKDDNELETRFRRQAFEVKKHLTAKGVFAHLEKNREGHFPPPFADAADKKEKAEAAAKAAAVAAALARAPKVAPKAPVARRDTGKEYTYYVNRPATTYPNNDDPSQFAALKHGSFEFIPLDSVYFPHDVDTLNDRARSTLDSVTRYIFDHPEADRVLIMGHADYTGTEGYNYLLTDRRALNVREYLLSQGVSNRLLEVTSAGENDAVDENWTRSGQARNRRVQLFVIYKRDIEPPRTPSSSWTLPSETEPAPAPFLYPGATNPNQG